LKQLILQPIKPHILSPLKENRLFAIVCRCLFVSESECVESFLQGVFEGPRNALLGGKGTQLDGYAVTLDGGAAHDGPLVAASVAPDGQIAELFEA